MEAVDLHMCVYILCTIHTLVYYVVSVCEINEILGKGYIVIASNPVRVKERKERTFYFSLSVVFVVFIAVKIIFQKYFSPQSLAG